MSEANTDLVGNEEVVNEEIVETHAEQTEVPTQEAELEAAPEWTPDFKFKVMDEEHEIPEMYRSLVKDEDSLKEVRRLHERALGVPHLEKSRDEYKQKWTQAAPTLEKFETIQKNLGYASNFVQKGDFDSFFKTLNIPEDAVHQWYLKKLHEQDLPEETRQRLEHSRAVEAQNYAQMQELQALKAQQQHFQQTQQLQQVETLVNTKVGDLAKKYGEVVGSPTAFRDAVIETGRTLQQQDGVGLPLDQVVDIVKGSLEKLWSVEGAAPAGVETATQVDPIEATVNKPSIPNARSGNSSPVKQQVRTLQDLTDRYNAL